MNVPEQPKPPTPPASPTEGLGAPASPKSPWWQRGWGVATIGVVGLIVGAGIGAAAGGNSKTVTETQRASARTVTNTVTTGRPRVVVHTHTITVTTESKTPAPSEEGSGGGVQSFSGNGGKNLGSIKVEKESTLEWTNDGAIFQIFTNEGVPVNSQAHSGTTVLEPNTYSKFQVNAEGNWTIKIVPK
jgi:hypothetical protein